MKRTAKHAWIAAIVASTALSMQAAAQPAPPTIPGISDPAHVAANKAALMAYIEAVNSKNQAVAAASFAPNATIEEPVGSAVRSGEAAAAFIKIATSGVVRYEVVSPLRGSGDSVAAVLKVHAPNVVINAIEVYTFDAMRRITNMRAYFDPSDIETLKK